MVLQHAIGPAHAQEIMKICAMPTASETVVARPTTASPTALGRSSRLTTWGMFRPANTAGVALIACSSRVERRGRDSRPTPEQHH